MSRDYQAQREFYRKRYAYNAKFVQTLKVRLGCADCGWREHHSGLEWDHVMPRLRGTVSGLLGKNLKVILEELGRCECVCSRCHALRTWSRAHPDDAPSFADPDVFQSGATDVARLTMDVDALVELAIKSVQERRNACSCGRRKLINSRTCSSCYRPPTKIAWPASSDLQTMVDEAGYRATGKQLGVSDTAVKKRLLRHS